MINHLRDDFGVEPVCRELGLSVSAFNARHRRPKFARRLRDEQLVKHIRRAHDTSGETYGARCFHHQLRREGITAVRCTISLLASAGETLGRLMSPTGCARAFEEQTHGIDRTFLAPGGLPPRRPGLCRCRRWSVFSGLTCAMPRLRRSARKPREL
ncbi:IS3 family transposase [Streptomyces sp. NPDC002688]|uniref:IS3 family transposase n=1 Tax=Streptomyces sp. NPDC002688 TaxID=3154423 RepID=UPI003320E908